MRNFIAACRANPGLMGYYIGLISVGMAATILIWGTALKWCLYIILTGTRAIYAS